MDEMVMRPPAGGEAAGQPARAEAEAIKPEMPWLERERLGPLRAWFRTVGKAMAYPSVLIDATPEWTPRNAAFAFAAMNAVLYFVCGTLPSSLFGLVTGGPLLAATATTDLVIFGIGGLLIQVVFLYVWFRLTHALLWMMRGTTAPEARTWHALGYSSAAGALSGVPLTCISAVGGVWWMVSATVMLARAHRCSGAQAALATILAGIIAAVPGLAFMGYPIYRSFTNMIRMNAGGPLQGGLAGAVPDPLGDALAVHVASEGAWPEHALLLMVRGVTAPQFTLDGVVDGSDQVAGTRDLQSLSSSAAASPAPGVRGAEEPAGAGELGRGSLGSDHAERIRARAAEAAAALPKDHLGHRVGDWMFIYRGRPPQVGAVMGEIWIAVAAPPGGARELFARQRGTFRVITGDGQRRDFMRSQWPMLVRHQNRLRRAAGLPALTEDYSLWCGSDVLRPD
jgi:hypothetical protein